MARGLIELDPGTQEHLGLRNGEMAPAGPVRALVVPEEGHARATFGLPVATVCAVGSIVFDEDQALRIESEAPHGLPRWRSFRTRW